MRFSKGLVFDPVVNFINARSAREKKMLLALCAGLVLFLDYRILIAPAAHVLHAALPKLTELKGQLDALREDKKNRPLLERQLSEARLKLAETEKRFIASNDIPALLENLSKLAQDSGLRITSLKPVESGAARGSRSGLYVAAPIEISALAGTHELGHFLESLENHQTFFKLTDLKISENRADAKRHLIEIKLEAFKRL